MKWQISSMFSHLLSIISILLLAWLLTACSLLGIQIGGGNNTTRSKPTATATPSPTAAPSLTIYKGDGYSIGYPQGWTVKNSGALVTITDPSGLATFVIQVSPDPGGVIAPSAAVNEGLNLFKSQGKNYQQVSVAPTTSLAGTTWNQGAATEDVTKNGQTANAKAIVISCNYPAQSASTKLFTLAYSAPSLLFDQTNTLSFQPMLQSFKFA